MEIDKVFNEKFQIILQENYFKKDDLFKTPWKTRIFNFFVNILDKLGFYIDYDFIILSEPKQVYNGFEYTGKLHIKNYYAFGIKIWRKYYGNK